MASMEGWRKYASGHDARGGRPPMTSGEPTDQALLRRFLEGDREAFHDLMTRHEDRVFAICIRIMGTRDGALDAVQETFLTVFRKADRFSGRSAFGTWLYRVAVNTCYDQLRKTKRHRALPLEEAPMPTDVASSDAFAAAELRPEIEAALAALPDEFRAAIVLVDLEDVALSDAAAILEVPIGTIKSRVFRGRRLLADALGNLASPSEHPIGEHDA